MLQQRPNIVGGLVLGVMVDQLEALEGNDMFYLVCPIGIQRSHPSARNNFNNYSV